MVRHTDKNPLDLPVNALSPRSVEGGMVLSFACHALGNSADGDVEAVEALPELFCHWPEDIAVVVSVLLDVVVAPELAFGKEALFKQRLVVSLNRSFDIGYEVVVMVDAGRSS